MKMSNHRNSRKPVNQQKSPRDLSISFSNIRGLRTNFTQCEAYLSSASPDILALCETNLDESISSSSFFVPGYLPLIRLDSNTHMHGLGVFVKDSLPIARVPTFEIQGESFMCFRLSLIHTTSYVFFLYRSPSTTSCSVLEAVSNSIDKALSLHPSAKIFVFGDFNVHHSNWLKFSNGIDLPGQSCYNFALSHDLSQIVEFPTRIPDCQAHRPALLDLFLTSSPDNCAVKPLPALGSSDHCVVAVTVDFMVQNKKDAPFHRTVFDYSRADWDGFRDHLRDIPWDNIFEQGVSLAATEFSEWMRIGMDVYVPHRKFQVRPHSSPWFTPACAAAIAHRNHYFNLYQRNKSDAYKTLFRQASNRCKRVIEQAKLLYTERTRDQISSQKLGTRDFWRIANSVLKRDKSSIPPLFNGPEVLTLASDKAKLFGEQFAKNSTLNDKDCPLPNFPKRTNISFSEVSVTPKLVSKAISQLEMGKASGPDEIPVVVLKNCAPELSFILSRLFNMCLQESVFPDCWKVSSVVPVFKNSGEKSDPKNYRPISLLPVVSKLFERLINNRLVQHLEATNLFSDYQYGFRSARSTADLLTVITERVYRSLDKCGGAQAVALDISKAFDKVWHAGLLHKLASYGVSGKAHGIISSFLKRRKMNVVLDGKSSGDFSINAGVPQGSILGPTLFLLYINDLPDDIISKIAIYADDTTLYGTCSNASNVWSQLEMAADLEADLGNVVEWGKKWLVSFNAAKTQCVPFTRSKNWADIDVKMQRTELEKKESLKLLGLSFSSTLGWGAYIESIAKATSKKVGALIRSMNYLTPEIVLHLYKTTIRPCMEYCCHVWGGAPKCYLDLLDKLQRRICYHIGPTLSSSLDSLAHRRNVASLSLFYRYYFGRCSSELARLVPLPHERVRPTRYSHALHDFVVDMPRFKKDFYRNSFFPRTASLWNSLPAECFPLTYNLNQFKANVNRHLLLLAT